MGNTLSMARSKDSSSTSIPSRRATNPMLLASGKPRVSTRSSLRGDKRKKTAATKQRTKGHPTKDFKEESSLSAAVENPDGSSTERKRYRRSNKDRQQDRGVERTDRTPRRSANELGIEWIGDFCPDDKPHYLIDKHTFNGGSLFKCSHCRKHIWLPTYIKDATELEMLIKRSGTQNGYCKFLDKNQEAKVMVAKLQDLWYARRVTPDKETFRELVISVMEDKEYDQK